MISSIPQQTNYPKRFSEGFERIPHLVSDLIKCCHTLFPRFMTNAPRSLHSLSCLMDDSRHRLSAEKLPPQNGRSSSVYFSEGIVSLLGISPPPAVPSLRPSLPQSLSLPFSDIAHFRTDRMS